MSKRAKDAINDIKHLTEIQGSDHAPILLDLDVWFTDDELVEESRNLARQYEALAKRRGLPYANAGEWDIELAYDGVHFTEVGHACFAGGLASCLEVIL